MQFHINIINLQELRSNRSHSKHNKPNHERIDENSRYSTGDASMLNLRVVDCSTGGSRSEGHGNSKNKGSSKQHSIHKQRLFPGNFKAHGSSRNSLGIISESPPSDSVGFFFGSTPPDSNL